MSWFWIAVIVISLITKPALGIFIALIYGLYRLIKNTSSPIVSEVNTSQPAKSNQSKSSAGNLADLVLLRLELKSLFDAQHITDEYYRDLTQRIDDLYLYYLKKFNASPNNRLWQTHRDAAWQLLNQYSDTPLGLPPWRCNPNLQPSDTASFIVDADTSEKTEYEPILDQTITLSNERVNQTSSISIAIPELSIPETTTLDETPSTASLTIDTQEELPAIQANQESEVASTTILNATASPATFSIDEQEHPDIQPYQQVEKPETTRQPQKTDESLHQYAWQAQEPSRIENVFKTISGWHSLAIPFLVQNIGWFIGVFCFISGSTFLVYSTKGYVSNLIAFFAFFIFTLTLLVGGYQLRQKRPELETSSYVIFILSVLLIPLTTITATQLLISSDSIGLNLFSALLVVAELAVFYIVVMLVSGLISRSLQQGLPQFFIGLTAVQCLQVFLLAFPNWQLLASIHLVIFVLLSVGSYLFVSQWLQAIFLDKDKIAYFAAGTLIYAAVVSFVFITVGNDIALPNGYYGFFLMLLCYLLFFIDVQLKHWIEHYAALSRFSFFVYGLSLLALGLTAPYQTACFFTLLLAIGLYAFIVYSYLTLIPLSILLVCYFWLYYLLVLQHLANSSYLLASLPVLASLYYLSHWALNKRQSAYLAVIVYRVLYGLLASLTIWSLLQSSSSLIAMLTALTASVLVYFTLKATPVVIFTPYSKINPTDLTQQKNLLASTWFYCIPALSIMTVFYAPAIPFLINDVQFSLGLLGLSYYWSYRGLSGFFKQQSSVSTEHSLNSASLIIIFALLPLWNLDNNLQSVLPLFLTSILLLCLSYQLLSREFFYLALVALILAFMPIKAMYIRTPSGLGSILVGISIWVWVWFIEQRSDSELYTFKREQISQKLAVLPQCQLLGFYTLPRTAQLFSDLIKTPLIQIMCLLWLLAIKTLFTRFIGNQLSYAWLAALCLHSVFSVLLIIRYQFLKAIPIPVAFLLATVLMVLQFWQINHIEHLLFASLIFALVLWQTVSRVFSKLDLYQSEDVKQITHLCCLFIVLVSIVWQLFNATGSHSVIVLASLMTTVLFLGLSNKTYSQPILRYLTLGFLSLAIIEIVSLTLHSFIWQSILINTYAGLLFALLSLLLLPLRHLANDYDKPAYHFAILTACFSLFCQSVYVIYSADFITPVAYISLFVAGLALFLSKSNVFVYFLSFISWAFSLLWLEHSVFHSAQAFSLWLGLSTFADLWLLLALLSLIMSLIANYLARPSNKNSTITYLPALNTTAFLCFCWALLGTLSLFFISKGQAAYLTLCLSVLLAASFLLSKNRSGAAQLRSLASTGLSSLIVFSLLPASFDGFALQIATMLWGYSLWLVARFILPRFNQSYENWQIEPIYFPYSGFLFVIFSVFWLPQLDSFSIGSYCLALSIYCVLMSLYSYRQGFAWLASIAFVSSVLALENFFIPHDLVQVDKWLTLALLSLSMSLASNRIGHHDKPNQAKPKTWLDSYYLPLNTIALFCFSIALIGTLVLFFHSLGQADWLASLFFILLVAVFSLSKNQNDAAKIRGFASASLLSLIAFSLLPKNLNNTSLQIVTICWAYSLWLVATFVLPRINKRYPTWEIAPNFFPYLGFLIIILSLLYQQAVLPLEFGLYSLSLSVYCVLMLRYSAWLGFAWLSAASFMLAGVAFNFTNEQLPTGLLLWCNLLLLLINFWQRQGEKLAQGWQWQTTNITPAFFVITQFILGCYLVIMSLGVGVALVEGTVDPKINLLAIVGLLNISLLHLLWLRFSQLNCHSLILSLFLLVWSLYFTSLTALFQPPLLLALWSLILLISTRINITHVYQESINNALQLWLRCCVILTTLALFSYSFAMIGELLLTLAITALLSAALGWHSFYSGWLMLARVECLLLLHGWLFLFITPTTDNITLLLPWYALQLMLLALLATHLLNRLVTQTIDNNQSIRYLMALQGMPWLIGLSLLELIAHGIFVSHHVMHTMPLTWLLPPFDAIAAFMTGLLICVSNAQHIKQNPDSARLYGIVALIGSLAFYGRLLWLGATPVNLWDTTILISIAYVLFFLHRLFPATKPLYNIALLMPILAVFTVPLQLASPETSVTLMITALLYAMMRHYKQQKIPLYFALVAFNTGVYLWVPNLVDRSQLIQVYVIPAALSVLMLLHLHKRELKPSVLMACRLATISSIYACATVDVFLRAELSIFILAMVLSIVGIVLGIALRTRAFLYAGVSFLLLNVIGQLIRFYPEQGLGRAIVLMVMGAFIISTMIWFSIKKALILQRIKTIQLEMQTWE